MVKRLGLHTNRQPLQESPSGFTESLHDCEIFMRSLLSCASHKMCPVLTASFNVTEKDPNIPVAPQNSNLKPNIHQKCWVFHWSSVIFIVTCNQAVTFCKEGFNYSNFTPAPDVTDRHICRNTKLDPPQISQLIKLQKTFPVHCNEYVCLSPP